jgi:hypothetical protein
MEKKVLLKELKGQLNDLYWYRDHLCYNELENFNRYKNELLELFNENQRLRLNRIEFYGFNDPDFNELDPVAPFQHGFKQAEVLIKDAIFKIEFDRSNPSDLKKIKLLEARINNIEFETELSVFVCGEPDNHFPYKSSFFLTRFFKDLGMNYEHDGSTRRYWVKDVLLQLSIKEISLIIEKGLFSIREFKRIAKDNNADYKTEYNEAITEFKIFFEESLVTETGVDLSFLLDLNVNIELLFDNKRKTKDNELDKLIQESKDRFFNPNYRIRHHETDKKEITNKNHVNYLFFRMLSLIDLCLSSIEGGNH